MGLHYRERRALEGIESTLCHQDRDLAGQYAVFARLVEGELPPQHERLKAFNRRLWLLILLLPIVFGIGELATRHGNTTCAAMPAVRVAAAPLTGCH